MDISDHRLQWGCPYCPRVFPSRDDVKEHLGQQHILDLLSHAQQALSPSCQQFRETTEGLISSDGGNDVDLESTKRSQAEEPLRCPHSDCKTNNKAFIRKDHLLRHFKTHVFCNVVCQCGDKIDIVDRLDKHVKDCRIILKFRGGGTDDETNYKATAVLGTKQIWHMTATEEMTKQLMSNDIPTSTIPSLKRKRSSDELGLLETMQQDSILDDCKGAVHPGSLVGLNSITSYTYIARNTPEATQAFGNSTSHLHPNESTNDPSIAKNNVDGSSPTHESNDLGHTQPSQIETDGLDWNDFYTASGAQDWKSLYAIDFNNIQAEIWTDAQGQTTNI